MAKKLGEKAVFNRLQKELDKRFTEEQQNHIGFDIDRINDNYHTWVADYNGLKFELVCNKNNGKVEYREYK